MFTNKVMENTLLEERKNKISCIQQYLDNLDKQLQHLAGELNWDYDSNSQKESLVVCKFDSGHRVPKESLKDHEEKCKWIREGYHRDDKPLSESVESFNKVILTPDLQENIIKSAKLSNENFLTDHVFKVHDSPQEKNTHQAIHQSKGGSTSTRPVPQTLERQQQEFTRDERLALYDYVIAQSSKVVTPMDTKWMSFEEKKEQKIELTALELAVAERDAKRRRASYKNKVHTNRKTQTEILREVIASQMDCLVEEDSKNNEEGKEDRIHEEYNKRTHRKTDREKSHNYHRSDYKIYYEDSRERNSHKHEDRHSKGKFHEHSSREKRHDREKHKRDRKEENHKSRRDRDSKYKKDYKDSKSKKRDKKDKSRRSESRSRSNEISNHRK